MSDTVSFLEEDEPAALPEMQPEPTPEPEQPVAEPDAPEQPQPEPVPEPTPPAPQQQTVPLAAMLAERDRRAALEAELQRYRAQQQPEQLPDPYEQPEAFQRYQAEQLQQSTLNVKLDISEEMARQQHGDELVNTVQQWAIQRGQANPAFAADLIAQRNPYGYAVKQYQREQALEKLSDPSDLDDYLAWRASRAAQPGAPTLTAASAAPPAIARPAAPPRSLAAAPSAGGVQTQVEDPEPFDGLFPKKG